jgi:tellurite resistance protein
MAKAKKVTKEHLEQLQGFVTTSNRVALSIGSIEAQKHELLHQFAEVKKAMDDFQKELEAEYGDVQIDLQTGTITENASNS